MFSVIKKVVHNNLFAAACIIYLSWFVTSDNFSVMVGDLIPIVDPLNVISVELYELEETKLIGNSYKYYNCDFKTMDWFIDEAGVTAPLTSDFLDPPRGNAVGPLEFNEGIIVGIAPDRLSISHSTVTHVCWGGFEVTSDWYSGVSVKN